MRPVSLALALTLAACVSDPAPPGAPTEVERAAPTPSASMAASGLTVAVDSLLRDEPERNYRVAIGYPQIEGSAGRPMARVLRAANAAIRDSVVALADGFRPEAPPPGESAERYPVRVDGLVSDTYLSDRVMSALISVHFYTGGAHGMTLFLPLTLDLDTGRALAPADLFAPDSPWADTLAAWVGRDVQAQIRQRSAAAPTSGYAAEGLAPIREGQMSLTVGADSVAVHVPPYQLASYAEGSFRVAVPRRAVAPFARPGGVLDADR